MSSYIKRNLLIKVKRAIGDYNLILDKDVVVVGVSGGKDSLATLYALAVLRRTLPIDYELHAVTVDLGWPESDWSGIRSLCSELDVPFHVVSTDIGPIVFEHRQEENPCSLCSKMRNGALNNQAKRLGANVVALGHHRDDAIETLFLSLMYSGRIHCFSPITWLNKIGLYSIRPMIYVTEETTAAAAKRIPLPVHKSFCPIDGRTKRSHIKKLLANEYSHDPGMPARLFSAVQSLWMGDRNLRQHE